MSGAQLTHSQYLQTLCSLAVALCLEKVLGAVPTPPHHREEKQGIVLAVYTVNPLYNSTHFNSKISYSIISFARNGFIVLNIYSL